MKKTFVLIGIFLAGPAILFALNVGIKKDHVGKVHSIALVSVFSNAEIQKQDARAGGLVGTVGFLKKMKDKKNNPELAHFGGTELVQSALDAFTKELGQVKGWTVKDPKETLASADYQKFVEDYKKEIGLKAGEMLDKNRTTLPGMMAYLFSNNKDKRKLSQMADLAAKLGVDSVAVVDLSLSQRSTFVTAGVAGKVWPIATVTLQIFTSDGNVAVNALGKPVEAKDAVEMKLDNMEDTPAARSAFKEAINKSAEEFKDELNRHLP